ncbi:MAG: hypothetical protein NT027_03650, partial [Proteobacteria bacterium]|nr:hypothetical protein [Pseudomonadota bacterium]
MRKLVGDLAPSPLINSSIAFLPAVIGFGFYTVSGVTEINLPACLVIIFIAMANVTFCRVWHRIDTYLFRLAILYGYVPFQWIYLFAITGFYFNPFNGQVLSLLIFALCSGMTVMAILYFKTRMDVSSGAFAIKGISVAALWGSAAFSDGTLHTFVNNDQVQVEEIKTQSDSTNLLLSDSQFVGEKMIQKKSSLSRKARFDKACGFSSARSPIDLDPKTQGGRSRIELSELKTNVLVSRGVDTLFLGDISN